MTYTCELFETNKLSCGSCTACYADVPNDKNICQDGRRNRKKYHECGIECNEICEDEEDDNCDCESCHRAEQMRMRGI